MPQASPPPLTASSLHTPGKNREWAFLLAPITLAILAFLPSLQNGFVWDDHVIVVPVEAYRNFDLWKIFAGPANGLEYLPIRDLTLALDMQIWGDNPFGFHLTNLLLYLLSLPIIYFTTRELAQACGERREQIIAFFTTTIFALHPLHAEPVNFITGRNNILAMLFASAALWLCLRGLRRTPILCWLSIGLFGLGLLSKASVVFLPLFLAVTIALIPGLRRHPKRTWLTLLGFILLDAIAITEHLATAYRAGVLNPDVLAFGDASLKWSIVKALQIPPFYLWKFLVPYPLTINYPNYFLEGSYLLRAVLCGLALLSSALLLLRFARRGRPLPLITFLWYGLALGPVLNLIPNEPVVADRYAYPAILGLGMAAAWIVANVPRRAWCYALTGALCISWGLIDFTRCFDWRTDSSLWASAYAVYPTESSVSYAQTLYDAGNVTRAIEVIEASRPDHFYRTLLQGKSALASGETTLAIKFLDESKRRGGEHNKDVRLSLARAYERSGRILDALGEYLAVSGAASADPTGRRTRAAEMGIARLRERLRPQKSRLEAHARANPTNPKAQSDLATFLYESGEYQDAIRYYRRAIDIVPTPWALWYNLGLSYVKIRDYNQASAAYEQALARDPNSAPILNDLGAVSVLGNQYGKAIDYYRRAMSADPTNVDPAFNLGRLYLRQGQRQQARNILAIARKRAERDPALLAQIDFVIDRIP